MATDSIVFADVDYERDGKQMGNLWVPQSTNTSGWATLLLPIVAIKNGRGPTALLFGGNHGDEYEGPVALLKLARTLRPEHVQGRVIIMPALNLPAVLAGTRLSPLDGRNMNRAFPGRRDDTVTGMIAHYVSQVLIPLADLVVDIHSGGRSAHFLPSVNMHRVADARQMRAMLGSARAWGAPYIFIYRDVAGEGLLPSYAESLGKVALGTEMGGAAQFGVATLAITERGVYNVLALHGIVGEALRQPGVGEPQIVASEERDDYLMAPVAGIFEPFVELGAAIEVGQPVGQIHVVEQPQAGPVPVVARTSGMVMSRRSFPLTGRGECVIVVARPVEG